MVRYFLVFLFCIALLEGNVSLSDIEKYPSSRVRDFYIWQYLKQPNISSKQAKYVYKLVQNKQNYKIKKLYAKLVNDEIRYEFTCKKKKDLLSIKDPKCLNFAFSLSKTKKFSSTQRKKLLKLPLSSYNKTLLKLQNEPYSFESYKKYQPNIVISYLLSLPKSTLKKYFNKSLTQKDIDFLSSASNFNRLVLRVVTDYSLTKLQKSFIDVKEKSLSFDTEFYLGLNALRLYHQQKAKEFFKSALKAAKKQTQIDKTLFWLYLTTKDNSYLKELLLSMKINVYTLYAHDKMGVEVENYFSDLDIKKENSTYDLSDPLDWMEIRKTIAKTQKPMLFTLLEKYKYKNLQPVQRLILEKAFGYKMHGYITPYQQYLKDLPEKKQILVYSLMRQESDFIPCAVSRSYALGLMQLMPFLVDHLAKKQKESIKNYDELFYPQKNLQYALLHLEWLEKILDENPLYIAYAYNGGYGFFTRYKAQKRFQNEMYEPFMSMEMMRNSESREYGKRVLSNYVMYNKVFKKDFSIVEFYETLK